MFKRVFLFLFLNFVGLQAGFAQSGVSPQVLIKSVADEMLEKLTENKAELEAHPKGIYRLVEEKAVPHFDFRRISSIAMGRYWRQASEEQKAQIADQFRQLLVRTYATALLKYQGQKIQYLPMRWEPADTDATVPTRVDDGQSPAIPINYRVYRVDDTWLIYDIVIDGVSLVTNYRNSFASEIRKNGIDGLIARLAAHNEKLSQ